MQQADRKKSILTYIIYLILFLAGGAVFLTRSNFPTDWDACQFVLGMERFSPVDHQPHPPGYFFFISLAQWIKWITHVDNHTALLLTSALGSALLIPAIYRITTRLFPDRLDISIGAAFIALAAPSRLFFGVQALSYTWEGLFASLLILIALDIIDDQAGGNKSRFWWLWTAVYAIAGGFRPNLLLLLLPLGIFLAINRRWWENLVSLVLFSLITCTWLVPTAAACEGLDKYLYALRGHSNYFLASGLGSERILDNLTAIFNTPSAISGLHVFGWIILAIIGVALLSKDKAAKPFPRRDTRTLWIIVFIPLVLFHTFIFYTMRYSLLYFPILIPLMAWLCSLITDRIKHRREGKKIKLAWLIPCLLMIVSIYSFLTSTNIHSLVHLRYSEIQINHVAKFVKTFGNTENVTIVAGRQFRPWGVALSEFRVFHPMHALYPADLNPRLTSMQDMDTTRGDFYQPDAPESESVELLKPPDAGNQIIFLDEDAYNNLLEPREGWIPERITSRENIYWRLFPTDIIVTDSPWGISVVPIESE